MHIGIAFRDITPNVPMRMMGYGDRDHASEGVHDPLLVYVLFVKPSGAESFCWISADLCVFGPDSAKALKNEIAKKTGLTEHALILQGTHTHSGPDTYALHADESVEGKQYFQLLVKQISEAINEAQKSQKKATIMVRQGVGTIGVNRRGLDKPVDDRLFLLTLLDQNKQPFGTVMYYSCHLTALGVDNYLISSDWIGPVRQWFEKEHGMPFMYTQGAEGNVDPWTRGVLDMSDPDQAKGVSFKKLEEISKKMVGDVATTFAGNSTMFLENLTMKRAQIDVPLRYGGLSKEQFDEKLLAWKQGFASFLGLTIEEVPEDQRINEWIKKHSVAAKISAEETGKYVAEQFAYTQFLWAYRNNEAYIDRAAGTVKMPITVIDGGKIAFVPVPVEPLMDVNFAIKKRVAEKPILLCGLADGYFGYLPHGENFIEKDAETLYETVSSVFAPEAADIIISKALDLL
ncbi:MAG: neutral/alkaline non-lysosomal ceramidase N-terminal domain-containing protein [Sphaerochaetaceae bacterium]